MKKITFALGLVMSLGATNIAGASEILSIDEKYPPYMYKKNNEQKGIYQEITEEIFKKINIDVEIKSVPWKRLVKNIESLKTGGIGLYMNDARLEKYDFTEPMYFENVVAFVRKGSGIAIKKFEDLKGKKIGVVSGWSYGNKIKKAREEGYFKTEVANSDALNIKKLAKGRIDVIFGIPESTLVVAKNHSIDNKIEKQELILERNGSYIAFHKKNNKKELISKINKAINQLKNEGKIKEIVDTYLN